jgi:hypothetical protein
MFSHSSVDVYGLIIFTMVQNIIVEFIVFATVVYVLFSLVKSFLPQKTTKCGGCSGCSMKELENIKQNKILG